MGMLVSWPTIVKGSRRPLYNWLMRSRPPVSPVAAIILSLVLLAPVSAGSAPVFQDSDDRDEIEQGREADRQIEAQFGFYEDEDLNAYVTGIGERMAALSERPTLPWTFRVLDSPVVNAFALPGGFVYVTRGLVAYAGSEAELAGVIGHEIGHVTGRHSRTRQRTSLFANLAILNHLSLQDLIGDGDLVKLVFGGSGTGQ